MSILIIDQSPDYREEIRKILSEGGFNSYISIATVDEACRLSTADRTSENSVIPNIELIIADVTSEIEDRYSFVKIREMQGFIAWGESTSELPVKDLDSYKTLTTVFKQNFVNEDSDPPDSTNPIKLKKIATGKDHVSSPHEHEARMRIKVKKSGSVIKRK